MQRLIISLSHENEIDLEVELYYIYYMKSKLICKVYFITEQDQYGY